MSIHPGVVRAALRGCRPVLASSRLTVGGKRRMYDLFTRVARVPRGTGYDSVTIAGVPVEGVRPPGVESGATLLWIDLRNGYAMIDSPQGQFAVGPGDAVPGGGRVLRIERRGRGWAVVTTIGSIEGSDE